jgi:hypothetical protein
VRAFRYKRLDWNENCPPVNNIKSTEVENCRRQQSATEREFVRLKPDIVVIGAFWFEYNHIEGLRDTLRFFQRIGIPRIIVIGSVPYWPEPPQSLLYKAMRLDPLHRVPNRLSVFYPEGFRFDEQLRIITAELGGTFISAHDVFCNEKGCLVHSGETAGDIFQVDLTHFSVAGSRYLLSHIADEIFDGISNAESAAPAALPSHIR